MYLWFKETVFWVYLAIDFLLSYFSNWKQMLIIRRIFFQNIPNLDLYCYSIFTFVISLLFSYYFFPVLFAYLIYCTSFREQNRYSELLIGREYVLYDRRKVCMLSALSIIRPFLRASSFALWLSWHTEGNIRPLLDSKSNPFNPIFMMHLHTVLAGDSR